LPQIFKPPATQRVYDVCVVGSQLGGVVAGALLARRGYRVLHVDHDGVGAHYEDGGYLLPYAPAMIPSPRAFPAADAALAELGLTSDLGRALEPCTPDLQILLPRNRVDLPRDPAGRAAELRREWPGDAERLEAGFAGLQKLFDAATPFLKLMPPLPPAGLLERRKVRRALRFASSVPGVGEVRPDQATPFEGMRDHPLVRALAASVRFLGYLEGEASPLGLTRLLGATMRGVYRLPGGMAELREILRRKIAESRGELLGGESGPAIASAMEIDGRKIAAVRLAGDSNSYVARAFVVATDAPAVRRLLSASGAAKVVALLDKIRPSREMLTVNLVVRTAALPPALGQTAIAVRDPLGTELEDVVLLQVLPARRGAKKGSVETVPDERVVSAGAFIPADSRDGGAPRIAELAARVRLAVAEAIPFFERHLIKESVPALAAPTEGRGSRLLSHPLYEVALPQTMRVTGLPSHPPLKNLVFAGREVVPGLGLEGEFHAGVQAAGEVMALLKRRDFLK
jgi:phytoene dehydrogenase-like protein